MNNYYNLNNNNHSKMKTNSIHLLRCSSKTLRLMILLLFVGLFAKTNFAQKNILTDNSLLHNVDAYSANCNASNQYAVTAAITNVNSSSNYRWQWKNSSSVWVCFVNGNNSINGQTYNVTGSVNNLIILSSSTITFTNPNAGLQGLEIRMVISDGAGVDPCTLPVGNIWTSTTNHFINVSGTPCATNGTGSIGDRVWGDANGNGIQDAGETNGFTGVTVQLKNATGTVIATTSTNATGNYLFSGLAAGNYTVVFPISLSGATVTTQNVGADDNIDSDASQATGETGTITLGAGQNITNVDAGYCPTTLAIGNRVWNDVNNNGINDIEAGIAGVTVNLYKDNNNDNVADGAAIATITTDASGYYLFSGLVPGNYIVGVVNPSGYVSSSVNGGDPDNDINLDDNGQVAVGNETRGLAMTLNGGTEPGDGGTPNDLNVNITYDFGFYLTPLGSIGDKVFNDANGNGIQDAGELGITGVTVQLKNSAGTVIATTNTDANGNYLFSGLAAGNYSVVFPLTLNGSALTTSNVGADDNIDSDADQATGATGTISLAAGQNITNVDAGYCPTTLALGDRVFADVNNNGVRDATELGISGVTVYLYKDNNNDNIADGAAIATATTDVNGNYLFSNLVPGNYIVGVLNPAGYLSSTTNGGDPDNDIDVDDNGQVAVGNETRGLAITLTGGGEPGASNTNITYDFGFYPANILSIGNVVFFDQNNNGTNDATDPKIVGATVNLYLDANNDGIADGAAVVTTTTDASGNYVFNNLAANTYIVGVVTPAGYGIQSINGGDPDNNVDNDNNGVVISGTEIRSNPITVTFGGEPTTDGDGNNGNLTVDFALKGTGVIGNFVWNDTNGNGIQDAGEPGIGGVLVTLTYPNGQTVTTTTAPDGSYSFPNLAPTGAGQTYSVAFGTPAGYTPTGSNVAGSTEANDSDPIGGVVTGLTLTAGQVNNDVDAGFYQLVNVGNVVFFDQNNNGTNDATDPKIVGATVNLYRDANNDGIADGAAIATTTTDASGLYNFGGLKPDTYIVGVVTPAGYAIQSINGGDPDNNVDNDNNGVVVSGTEIRSNPITLAAGTEPAVGVDGDGTNGNLTVDFALKGTASIGDFVWNDVNSNGVQDVTEVGLGGVLVTLTYPNGQTVTTTTAPNGSYNFPNLAPTGAGQTYSVAFGTPAGYVASPSNVTGVGITDLNDSDPIGGVVSGITLAPGQANTTIDAGFYVCTISGVSFTGPSTICANEGALFNAVSQGVGAVYTWTFDSGTPATATGSSATSSWSTPGEYNITLTVTKNGCTGSFTRSIIITQAVFANAGPDADICSGSSTTLVGGGPVGATYSWTVVSGDPTSIDNGASQSSALVSPLVTTVYRLTVSQNGCTRIDDVTVFINVNKNPTADAGPNKVTLVGVPVTIGGNPTGTPPVAQPNAPLGYTWTPSTGLNDATIANPTVTISTPGTYNYQVIVYNQLTGCSDTSLVSVSVVMPVNVGNKVFYDKNNNGIQDPTDQGIAGVTVNLYADADGNNIPDGAAIATTTTVGTNGTYNFPNLFAGKYIVGVVIPTGYTAGATTATSTVTDNDNNTDNNGVNTVLNEVRSNFVTLSVGAEPAVGVDGDGTNGNLTVDFGLTGTAKLGNFVWLDQNRNGKQDATETGIANAVVSLTYPDGTIVSTNTNNLGAYAFDNLQPGTYSVRFTTPVGTTPSPSNVTGVGFTDANDSDPIAGIVSGIVLNAGDNNQTIDAGFFPPINIIGNVWHDVNGLNDNRINNTVGASPIPSGLFIYLVNLNTGLIEQAEIVLNDGTYSFLDVNVATSYKIVYSTTLVQVGNTPPKSLLPSGWVKVGENLGAGVNSGSDGIANGELFVDTEFINIDNANFGIKKKNGEVVIG